MTTNEITALKAHCKERKEELEAFYHASRDEKEKRTLTTMAHTYNDLIIKYS